MNSSLVAWNPLRILRSVRAYARIVMLAFVVLALSGVAVAGENATEVCDDPTCRRSLDQIWLVSSRHLPDIVCAPGIAVPSDPDQLQVQRLDTSRCWQSSDLGAFCDAHRSDIITVIYVHGNRSDWAESIHRGLTAYQSLTAPVPDAPAIRFVIWSWPSDQIRGQLQDVRVKAQRTDSEAVYLAAFVSRVPPESPVSLIGYSFGARIVTGALHLLGQEATATAAGQQADQRAEPLAVSRSVRVVLMAAAVHHDWLLPHGCHHRAFSQIDAMLNILNPCDPVLKHYQFVECRRSCAQALGFVGIPWVPADRVGSVEQINASNVIGKSHDEFLYFGAAGLFERIRHYAFWNDVGSAQ